MLTARSKFLANYNDEQTIRNLLTISDSKPVKPLLVRRLRIHGAVAVSEDEPEVAAGPEVYQVPDGPLIRIRPDQESIITEADILEVAATTNPNNPNGGDLVAMTLTDDAGKRFLEATTKLSEPGTKGYMVIMFDRKVVSAPRVLGPISSKLTLTGSIDAKTLAEQIQAAIDEVKAVELTPVANVQEDDVARVEEVLTEPGSYVTVPLKVEWHPEAAMKRHLGKRHLTVLADGNMQDERNTNAVSRTLRSLFHDCRLESFELTTRDEADYWNARIFVPLKAEYSIGALWYKDPIRTLRIGDRHTPVPAETLAQDEPQVKLDEELKDGFQLRLDDSTEGEPGLSFERESGDKGSHENNNDEADAFSKLAAMPDWVIAWDSQLPSDQLSNGRRLALLRGFADGRVVAVHGANAELVQTQVAPAEIKALLKKFAALGTKRNPVVSGSIVPKEPAGINASDNDDPLPRAIEGLIGNGLTVIHEGSHYDLMSFQPTAPNVYHSPALRRHKVAELSDEIRQQLMQLVYRARLGSFDECLDFANAQLRARYPDTPVELKASDIHQLYSPSKEVIEVIFRFGTYGKPVSFPGGVLKVRHDSEGNWSVVNGMYFPDESTSERWSGDQDKSINDDSKGHDDSASVETRLSGPYGFLTAKHSASLEDAVAAFNRIAAENEIGKTQKPLTAKEVIAAMRSWGERKECSEETRTVFQQIIETNELRPGDQLSFTSTANQRRARIRRVGSSLR